MAHSTGPTFPHINRAWNEIQYSASLSLKPQSATLPGQIIFLFHVGGTPESQALCLTKDVLLYIYIFRKNWHKYNLRVGYRDYQEGKEAGLSRDPMFFKHPRILSL